MMEREGQCCSEDVEDYRQVTMEHSRRIFAEQKRIRRGEELRHELSAKKSLCGNLPGQALEKMLPVELWEAVLDRLGNQDRIIVSKWSQLFDNQIQKWKTRDLFSQVFPLIHEYLDTSEILNSRLVCKRWKVEIDSYLATLSPSTGRTWDQMMEVGSFHLLQEVVNLPKMPPPKCELRLSHIEKIEDFNDYFELNVNESYFDEKFPFISRTLWLGPRNPFTTLQNPNDDFWAEAWYTLLNQGKKLWHLRLYFYFGRLGNSNYQYIFELLCNLLRLTPHLRSLEISHGAPDATEGAQDWNMMRQNLDSNDLPNLEHLMTLRAKHVPNITLNRILRKYRDIQTLSVTPLISDPNDFMEDIELPNLTYYSCDGITGTNVFQFEQCPKLERMRLTYRHMGAPSTWKIPGVIRAVNEFGCTLRHLEIGFHAKWGSSMKADSVIGKELWLCLPNLETLNLFLDRVNMKSIDVLVPLRSLKELTLRLFQEPPGWKEKTLAQLKRSRPYQLLRLFFQRLKSSRRGRGRGHDVTGTSPTLPPGSSPEIIQFAEFTGRMYESNIWSVFPELRKLKVKNYTVRTALDEGGFDGWDLIAVNSIVYTRDELLEEPLSLIYQGQFMKF